MTSSPKMADVALPDATLAKWQNLLDTVVEVLGAAGGVIRRAQGARQPLLVSGSATLVAARLAEMSAALLWPDGSSFGTLTIVDRAPRTYARAHQRLVEQTAILFSDMLAQLVAEAVRRARDAAHEEERERLGLAAAMGRTGVWDYSIDTDTLYCDPRCYEIVGRDPADVMKSVDDFKSHIHPEDVTRVIEGRIATLSNLPDRVPDQDLVFRIIRPDGEIRWLASAACMLGATANSPKRLIGFVTDITERHRAEERVQLSLASLRHAEGLAKIGSWTLNTSTGAFCCSEHLQEMIGLASSDPPLTPGDLPKLFSAAHFETVMAAINACVSTGASYQIDTEHLRLDGSHFIAHIRGEAMCNSAGKIIGMSGTVQDITERDEARRQLELQGRMLEKSAHELALARDAAVEASHAKSAFLASMSHELRTPLNAIIGFSEMMTTAQLGPIPDRYKDYAHDIHNSGLHLLELINQILDLSKIEAGRMELNEAAFSPREVLESCVRLLRERAEKAGVALELHFPLNRPPNRPLNQTQLWADELKFRQIVLNLLANAVKFTPAGGTVRLGADFEPGGFLVEVRDTGAGMSPSDIPAALEPFRQVGDDTLLKQQGTGLGLPLAKALAELHGGTLALQSGLREGTTVTVRFPVARVISRASAGDAA